MATLTRKEGTKRESQYKQDSRNGKYPASNIKTSMFNIFQEIRENNDI